MFGTTLRGGLAMLAFGIIGITTTSADEKARTATDDATKPAVKAKESYQVFGGGCRRSMRLLGTYDSANEACWAAARFRKDQKLQVEVTIGGKGDLYSYAAPAAFVVYRNPCKGFSLEAKVDTREKAQKLVDAIVKSGEQAEIVMKLETK